MKLDLAPLTAALRRARSADMAIPIWWRDDDVIEPTAELDALIAMGEKTQCSLHLAVIPKDATVDLAKVLPDTCVPVMHGWSHANNALPGAKKSEFGHDRADAKQEIATGLVRMESLFQDRFAKIFVPPWNRIAPEIEALLPSLGFHAVSTFGPRRTPSQINTHIDPIDWKGTRDLLPPERLIAQTVQIIDDRLSGQADPTEPLGLLTHHLVHTKAIWEFSAVWLDALQDGGAVPVPHLLETQT